MLEYLLRWTRLSVTEALHSVVMIEDYETGIRAPGFRLAERDS
jgi:hypothetical protein